MIPNLSAGSGPAAIGLAGIVFYLVGQHALGVLFIIAAIVVSLVWAGVFKRF